MNHDKEYREAIEGIYGNESLESISITKLNYFTMIMENISNYKSIMVNI